MLMLFAVFAVCSLVRVHFILQRGGLDGDEHTSFVLAYNSKGWFGNTFEPEKVYEATELKNNLFVDDRGGWKGYAEDMATLWNDNRDPSHASLYYMALRTFLIGQDHADLKPAIHRACALNMVLFAFSFLVLSVLLLRVFPQRFGLVSALLALAFLNPASVSMTLLAREYQFAEMIMNAFALLCVGLWNRIDMGGKLLTLKHVTVSSVLIAAFVSTGYFNVIFVLLAGSVVLWHAVRANGRRELLFVPAVLMVSVSVCLLMYAGYFRFLGDSRTVEVSSKLRGASLFQNLFYSASAAVRMLVLDMFGCVSAVLAVFLLAVALFRKRLFAGNVPCSWLGGCAFLWFSLVFVFTTWKLNRYSSPGVPLLMAFLFAWLIQRAGRWHRAFLSVAVVLAFVHTVWGNRVKFVYSEKIDFPKEKRVFLMAHELCDCHTLTLLTPMMADGQECVILTDIGRSGLFTDSPTVSVIADHDTAPFIDPCAVLSSRPLEGRRLFVYTVKNREKPSAVCRPLSR